MLLYHFRKGEEFQVYFPFFLVESIRVSIQQVKNREELQMRKLGLITFLYGKALAKTPSKNIKFG